MKLIEFPEQTVVIAKDQAEYLPMPAFQYANDPTGRVTFCWKLPWWQRVKLLFTGKLWHTVMTFHQPLQPQMLHGSKPFTAGDVVAARVAKQAAESVADFRKRMLEKYGEKARKKGAHMTALNYHANDRRRVIEFAPADFAEARRHGVLFLEGCRIVDHKNKSAV